MIPDGEVVLMAYLREAGIETPIVGSTPRNTGGAWARVTMLDAPSDDLADWLVEFYFQIDCYASEAGVDGSQQKEAMTIARQIRAALSALNVGTHVVRGAVITGANANSGARRPDPDLDHRERVQMTVTVWMHPEVDS